MEVSINDVKTFAGLISAVGIEIPLIQRDYVQGRVHDIATLARKTDDDSKALLKKYIKERERRDGFVQQLVSALEFPDKKQIQLTFIYGTVEDTSTGNMRHTKSFIPLDGQQRLTTLFLLSWLLIHKQTPADIAVLESDERFANLKKGLRSFNYKTRPSSGVFCTSLVSEKISPIEGGISKQIREQSWFGDEWNMDPSVLAMLQMLDRMEAELAGKNVKLMLNSLLDGRGIEFNLLDMEDYKLTDGLYIKMNARGKQLTEFENWKSEFIGFLNDRYANTIYNGHIDGDTLEKVFNGKRPRFGSYFAHSIEHQWTDLFWEYCKEIIRQHAQDQKMEQDRSKRDRDCYPVIDKFFMNVFEKLTQIFFFESNPTKRDAGDYRPSKEIRDEIYGDPKNVENLFAYLDILCKLKDTTFNALFYIGDNQTSGQNGKVRLFDNANKTVNLLTRCTKEDSTAESDTLLYALLKYIKEFGLEVDADMKNFVRLIRNCIEGKRALKRDKSMAMVNDYFLHSIHETSYNDKSVSNLINKLIEQKKSQGVLPQCTVEEAAIEDFDFIRGVKKIAVPGFSAAQVYEVLKAWDLLGTVEKQRILIAYGFRGHYTTACNHGQLYLWGGDNKWDPIFVHDDGRGNGNVGDAIKGIVEDYYKLSGIGGVCSLRQLIENKKAKLTNFDFEYYALQYDEFLLAHASGKKSCCYLSVKDNSDINELDLVSAIYSPKPTLGYHTDPIVFTLKNKLQSKTEEEVSEKLYLAYSTKGAVRASLYVYDSKKGDEGLRAIFRHNSGIHGNGGWDRLEPGTDALIKRHPDEVNKDRIQSGFDFVTAEFPNVKFDEHE